MTSVFSSRRLVLLAALAASVLLASCKIGGSSGNGSSYLRTLNLTDDLPSLDLYVGGNKQFSSATTGTLTNYNTIDANTYTVNVNAAGNTGTLFTGNYTLTKNDHYTAVVWGPQSAMRVSTLPEDDDTTQIATGNMRIRMFNATIVNGTFDVYLTSPTADLTVATPTQAALTTGTLAGFKEIPQGTYRLRVTGAGNPSDIRLDIPAVTLNTQQYATIVLTAGSGGLLVNGTLVVEQGAATGFAGGSSRVRLISSVDSAGQVGASVAGMDLATTNAIGATPGVLRSPNIGQYTIINAGSYTVTTTVNGVSSPNPPLTFVAGADYTLMVMGTAAAPKFVVINDNNGVPLSATRVKMRMINGVNGLDPLTLTVDNGVVGNSSQVAAGTASQYQEIAASTGAVIEVDSPSLGAVYLTTNTNGDKLIAQGVYTMFVLSGNVSATGANVPKGRLLNDRPS